MPLQAASAEGGAFSIHTHENPSMLLLRDIAGHWHRHPVLRRSCWGELVQDLADDSCLSGARCHQQTCAWAVQAFAAGAESGAVFLELCQPEVMNSLICKTHMRVQQALPDTTRPAQHLVNLCTQVLVGQVYKAPQPCSCSNS